MAVKTITNNSAVNTENVNRAEQKSFRNSSIRGGNKESTGHAKGTYIYHRSL